MRSDDEKSFFFFFALCQYRINENIWRYLCWWDNLFGENENKVVLVSTNVVCFVGIRRGVVVGSFMTRKSQGCVVAS
jgi:hypothetical protein